jgi:hypothetical protein
MSDTISAGQNPAIVAATQHGAVLFNVLAFMASDFRGIFTS